MLDEGTKIKILADGSLALSLVRALLAAIGSISLCALVCRYRHNELGMGEFWLGFALISGFFLAPCERWIVQDRRRRFQCDICSVDWNYDCAAFGMLMFVSIPLNSPLIWLMKPVASFLIWCASGQAVASLAVTELFLFFFIVHHYRKIIATRS